MLRILWRSLFITICILMMNNVPANSAPPSYATSNSLPPGFAVFVPKDFKLGTCQTTTSGNAAGISFVASKQAPHNSAILHEYRLGLDMRGVMAQLIKMQGPIYFAQLDKDITAKRQSYAARKSDPVTGYDAAIVTKYPWGYGIAQRQLHHYAGAGAGSDEIDYMCEYLGLIIDDTSMKKFELLVSGVKTSEEADQWAKKIIEKIGKTTLANIRD
jgi:hypothetical protein